MTEDTDDTLTRDSINLLLEYGLSDGLARFAELLMNAGMIIERSSHLQAGPHERIEQRKGHAIGFKPRSLATSLGKFGLQIPQVCGSTSPFKTSLLESGSRVDRALKAAIAEMYLQGISTRRVTKLVEELRTTHIETSEYWETGRTYLTIQTPIHNASTILLIPIYRKIVARPKNFGIVAFCKLRIK